MKKLFLVCLIIPLISIAESTLEIDLTEAGDTKFTITDICKEKHILIVKSEDAGSDKPLKWLNKLGANGELDKCVETIDK